MATQVKNVKRKQGDTYDVVVTIMQSDGVTAYDLTGTTEIRLGVATKKELEIADTPTFNVVGAVDGDPTTGKATFPIDTAEAAIVAQKYYAEVQFIQNTDIVTTDTFNYEVTGQIIY